MYPAITVEMSIPNNMDHGIVATPITAWPRHPPHEREIGCWHPS